MVILTTMMADLLIQAFTVYQLIVTRDISSGKIWWIDRQGLSM